MLSDSLHFYLHSNSNRSLLGHNLQNFEFRVAHSHSSLKKIKLLLIATITILAIFFSTVLFRAAKAWIVFCYRSLPPPPFLSRWELEIYSNLEIAKSQTVHHRSIILDGELHQCSKDEILADLCD